MLLEGTDIRELLQQVRDEYGAEARIIHAERIRTGGVGGFFARQRFEVTVEVDSDGLSISPGAVEAIAEAIVADDESQAAVIAGLATQRSAIDDVLDSATVRDGDVWVPSAAAPRPSLVSASLTDDLPFERAARAAVEPTFHDTVIVEPVVAPSSAATVTAPATPSVTATPQPLSDPRLGLTAVGPAATALRVSTESTVAGGAQTPVSDLLARLQSQHDAAFAGLSSSPAQDVPARGFTPLRAPEAVASASTGDGTPIADEVAESIAPVLTLLGSATPDLGSRAVPGAESHAAQRPAPLMPRRPGDVLVVLGDPAVAYAAALRLAASARIPAEHVHLVSPDAAVAGVPTDHHIVDLLEARLRSAQMAMNRTAGIVVVDAPLSLMLDPQGAAWVADVVAAIDPAAVWAVVDATRRAEDLGRWLAALPELDALVVHDHALTSDPDAVHSLGVPVAVIDGRSVTSVPAYAPASSARPTQHHLSPDAPPTAHRRSS